MTDQMFNFNTLAYARQLEKNGFSKQQSEALAMANADVLVEWVDKNSVTKTEFNTAIGGLRGDINSLEHRMDEVEYWMECVEKN